MKCFFFSSPEATPILHGIFFSSSNVMLIRLFAKELLTASPRASKKQVQTSPTAPFSSSSIKSSSFKEPERYRMVFRLRLPTPKRAIWHSRANVSAAGYFFLFLASLQSRQNLLRLVLE